MPEPTLHGCSPQTASGTWTCGCAVPAAWIPGGLALEGCLDLSYLVTMTMYEVAAALHFLITGFQMALYLACHHLCKARTCSCHALCQATCLAHQLPQPVMPQCPPLWHLLIHSGSVFFKIYTLASFPKTELIIWNCKMPMKGSEESNLNKSCHPVNTLPSWNMTHLHVTKLHLGIRIG